ncbi:hypothetical protein QT381_00905 [Galbitalea sp. SE-J8]|uniref:GNAT family N-acetyltransferase n=1 Tax=Galbitalea sp. SE-J8 TaxID=3054952 RepID=UPI00259C8FC9|nr:hypothetical protein [Galbitalea sp. SE-J8]MDM4761567.1 hypothetical protein [Galbitalea sp. SE-J8]
MSAPPRASRTSDHRIRLATAGRRVHVLDVLTDAAGRQVRGFALAQPPTASDAPTGLELQLLYPLASEHGSGSGQALLDAAIGDAPAHLWMAEGNARAERCYARNGFERDGARRSEPAWEDLVEVCMVRR